MKNSLNTDIVVKELQFSRILNKQNIFLGFFGAFALTIFTIHNIPLLIQGGLILVIIVTALILLVRSGQQLDDILHYINYKHSS